MFFIIPEYKIEQRPYINNGAWAASCYPRRQIHARCDLDKNILKQAVDERYLLFFPLTILDCHQASTAKIEIQRKVIMNFIL